MKGPEATRSLPKTDLFYLYEGPRTTRSHPKRNLFCLYEGPRGHHKPQGPRDYQNEGPQDHQKLRNKDFVLPI